MALEVHCQAHASRADTDPSFYDTQNVQARPTHEKHEESGGAGLQPHLMNCRARSTYLSKQGRSSAASAGLRACTGGTATH